jgi:hypothetical protein
MKKALLYNSGLLVYALFLEEIIPIIAEEASKMYLGEVTNEQREEWIAQKMFSLHNSEYLCLDFVITSTSFLFWEKHYYICDSLIGNSTTGEGFEFIDISSWSITFHFDTEKNKKLYA